MKLSSCEPRHSKLNLRNLPRPIQTLLSKWGHNPTEIFDVTVRTTVAEKRAYRLIFADGSQAKARLLLGSEHATCWGDLRRKVGRQPFLSTLLSQEGAAVLEEWVEGDVLPHTNPSAEFLQTAGAVLAGIHYAAGLGTKLENADAEVVELCSLISALARLSAITQHEADQLAIKLSGKAPARMHVGLAHHDFCGENLVLHASRGVVSIDHEWMRVGSLDFDVARAIRQWGLTQKNREIFLRGYAAAGGPFELAHLDFWLLANDIFASEVRVRRGWTDAPATVRRLKSWIGK
jgi:thiamine kinase-like enzyme